MAAAAVAAATLAWAPCAPAQDDTYYQGYAQDPGAYTADPAAPAAEAAAPTSGGGDTLSQIGWGALTAVTNMAYVPAKLLYAGLGGLTGGLALGLTGGDMSTAQQIWEPSLGGDYFLTPGQLQGEKGVSFAGAAAQLTEPLPGTPGAPAGETAAPSDPAAPQYGG